MSGTPKLYGNLEFDYKIKSFPELRAVLNLGYDRSYGVGSSILSAESINGFRYEEDGVVSYIGSESHYTSERKNLLLDAYLAYNKELENLNERKKLYRNKNKIIQDELIQLEIDRGKIIKLKE